MDSTERRLRGNLQFNVNLKAHYVDELSKETNYEKRDYLNKQLERMDDMTQKSIDRLVAHVQGDQYVKQEYEVVLNPTQDLVDQFITRKVRENRIARSKVRARLS